MVDKEKYIKRFQEIYKSKTDKEIPDADALASFEHLVTLVAAIYAPIPRIATKK